MTGKIINIVILRRLRRRIAELREVLFIKFITDNATANAVLRFAQDDRKCFYIFAHIQLCCNMIGLLRKQCFEYTETVGADIIRPLYAGQFSELSIIGD